MEKILEENELNILDELKNMNNRKDYKNTIEISINLFNAMRSALNICEPDSCSCMRDLINDGCQQCRWIEICNLMAEDEASSEK